MTKSTHAEDNPFTPPELDDELELELLLELLEELELLLELLLLEELDELELLVELGPLLLLPQPLSKTADVIKHAVTK